MQPFGLGAKLHSVDHVLRVHRPGGQNEQLVACFSQGMLKGQPHSLCLELRVARYCAIDDMFDAAACGNKNKQQH